jgi:hypothetical protein
MWASIMLSPCDYIPKVGSKSRSWIPRGGSHCLKTLQRMRKIGGRTRDALRRRGVTITPNVWRRWPKLAESSKNQRFENADGAGQKSAP